MEYSHLIDYSEVATAAGDDTRAPANAVGLVRCRLLVVGVGSLNGIKSSIEKSRIE